MHVSSSLTARTAANTLTGARQGMAVPSALLTGQCLSVRMAHITREVSG